MKRFHVHVAVDDIAASTRFYTALFGLGPTVLKDDYAKWQLDDPRVNFAISHRGNPAGVNHLGIQTDDDAELEALQAQLGRAEVAAVAEQGAACCYARSNKYWVTDPSGLAWETFHTLGEIPTFNEAPAAAAPAAVAQPAACCTPAVVAPTKIEIRPRTKA
ncbi:MAG: ArsI/CadI family heavy metal resistance metalloenzyme [Betaproteobacteria bacterium]